MAASVISGPSAASPPGSGGRIRKAGASALPIIAGLVVVIAVRRVYKRRKKRHMKDRSIRRDDD